MDDSLLIEHNEPEEIRKACVIANPNLSFEFESEEETLNPNATANLKTPQTSRVVSGARPIPMTRETFNLELNATLEQCGISKEEIISAASNDHFVEIGSTENQSRNCFLVKPREEHLMDLDNLLFIEFPASLVSALDPMSGQLASNFEHLKRYLILGEIEDIFGKLESPLYKVRESKLLSMVRERADPGIKVFAIESKISRITESDIRRMKREKKSDASGQFDQEIDQGYALNAGDFSDDEEERKARRLKGKRANPFTPKSDLEMMSRIDMFGKNPIKLEKDASTRYGPKPSRTKRKSNKRFRSKRVKSEFQNRQLYFGRQAPPPMVFQPNSNVPNMNFTANGSQNGYFGVSPFNQANLSYHPPGGFQQNANFQNLFQNIPNPNQLNQNRNPQQNAQFPKNNLNSENHK